MQQFAYELAGALDPRSGGATLLLLSGELGAGKTTFVQGLAAALGVEETVQSPTFVIAKTYALKDRPWRRLVHIDAYRLASAHELAAIGWNEVVASKDNLVVLEWPERVEDAIPADSIKVAIEIEEGDTRVIRYG
jgi:tRNA threonylcarbamoyladenosine biosynthesis protein TsaE